MSRAVHFSAVIVGLIAMVSAHGFGRGLFGHPPPPPCGLPPFVDDLPADAQKKLREIWADYKEGEKCYHQHGLTRELMDSLPDDVRREIHKGAFVPPPLKKAPKDIQDQFKAIMQDKSIPFEDKPKKMHELAQKILKGDMLKEFNDFHNKMEEHRKTIAEKAEKLSPEAKEAYDKIGKLEKEKHEIIHKLSEPAQQELFELYRERRDKFPKPL
ncbi:hypothetical protein NECAME_07527 [Necator americanus]|uniref:SXP/RAL-2 family protein Ani s 5-like cation-binding domain-containing protein n=1 Tax=Necator americanus TaxID=51031 RepID=W2TQ59_NECAM|nr:hypothetical protein NECAME_07527 [Necator americanus]ETN83167.1 hypothetical protein NECAME_07527 [Necator americanus]